MSNDAASIGVTYDGTDVQDADFGLHLEIVSGLADGLEVRGKDVVIPSLAGRVARNRVGDVRRIELRGHIMGNGSNTAERQADYRATMDQFDTLFDPKRDPAALVVTLEDGQQRTIDARPLPSGPPNEIIQSEFAYVSVVLESVDPEWTVVGS